MSENSTICTILGAETIEEAKKLIINQLFQQKAPLNGHVETVIAVCEKYNLNPMLGELYVRFGEGQDIYPTLTVDGWYNLVNSHPDCDGYEFVESEERVAVPKCPNQPDRATPLAHTAIGCKLYRKGRKHTPIIWEYFFEVFNPNNEVYFTHPNRMVRHRSFIQAARVVFSLSGVYDTEEVERILNKPQTNSNQTEPLKSTKKEQLHFEDDVEFEVVKPGEVAEEQPTSKPEVEATQSKKAEQTTDKKTAATATADINNEKELDDATRQQVISRLENAAMSGEIDECVEFLTKKLPQFTSEITLLAKEYVV